MKIYIKKVGGGDELSSCVSGDGVGCVELDFFEDLGVNISFILLLLCLLLFLYIFVFQVIIDVDFCTVLFFLQLQPRKHALCRHVGNCTCAQKKNDYAIMWFLLTQGLTLQVFSPHKYYKLIVNFLTCKYSAELIRPKQTCKRNKYLISFDLISKHNCTDYFN